MGDLWVATPHIHHAYMHNKWVGMTNIFLPNGVINL